MTLPYAASRCNNKQCHYNIDGGSGEKPFEYISGGKEFRVYAANFSINGIGLNIPLLSCNEQYGGTCITVAGIHFSVNRIKVVGSHFSVNRIKVVGSPISSIYLPVIYLSSGLRGATLSNSIFQNVRLLSMFSRVHNCSFSSSVTNLGSGDPVNVEDSYFFDTSIIVGKVRP